MNISVVDKSQSQKKIEVTISADEMQPYVLGAIKELGAHVSAPGFREGKLPAGLVRSTLGDGKIWEEAAQDALEKTLEKACKEHELDLLSLPSVEVLQLAPGNDFRYRATVEIIPAIVLCDIRAVAREVYEKQHRDVTVEEKDVLGTLEWLAKSRASYRDVLREVQRGDFVEIQYEGRIAGVTQQGLEQKSETLVVGDGAAPEDLEEELVGMHKGEEKDASVLFPKDFPDAHLRDKAVDMHVLVKDVKEREVPTIDDAFAKSLGGFPSVEDLKKSIRDGIQLEKEKKEEERITLLQLEEIARQSGVVAPQILTEQELARMKEEFSGELVSLGTTLDSYLEQIKKTGEDLKKGWTQKAEERVNAGIVLRAIAKQEKIEVDEQELEARANTLLARYKNEKEAFEHEGSADSLRARIRGAMRNEKVLELLKTS